MSTPTATDCLTVPADLAEPVPCRTPDCPRVAAWRGTYRPCGHMHTFCGPCQAKSAGRDRQYPGDVPTSTHRCCGAGIVRTDWRAL